RSLRNNHNKSLAQTRGKNMKLSQLLPVFRKNSNLQPRKERLPHRDQPLVVAQTAPVEPPPDSIQMLDSTIKFLRQYLICDDYQYTLLALWIVHTWCARLFPATPYLHIRSADSESAKTLCLNLLAILSNSPWSATGAHPGSIMDNLLTSDRRLLPGKSFDSPPPQTILLDDCHHTFAPSERQPLLALLNSGAHARCNYLDGRIRYSVFGPKAFAGNAPLPRSLASRCIPIVLSRKKPSDVIARFNPEVAASATRLARSLASWAAANSAALSKVANQPPGRLPDGLSARQQDCAEPLLHIADRIGGNWPDRARAALIACLKVVDYSRALELLADIRTVFFMHEDPSYLSSRDLMTALVNRENRPWAAWSSRSGRRIGGLLHPFGITSRCMHKGSGPTFKGFLREAFLDAWNRYLPPIPPDWSEIRATMKKENQLPNQNPSLSDVSQ
ncbi:MAG TPA: DUF3631 domain-containing protein, partial [Candidatus Angelobacter sp.]